MARKVIYFTVGDRTEQAEFSTDDSPESVRELFRIAAEAGHHDIFKLYNVNGNLVNITHKLPENTPASRYRLEVIAAHYPGSSMAAQLGFDLSDFEQRLQDLEQQLLSARDDTPDSVIEMKAKIEALKDKLEPLWTKHNRAAKTTDTFQKIFDKVISLSQVPMTKEVREYIRKPSFDNWPWDDAEMILIIRQMFFDLGFITKFHIEIPVLNEWLFQVYKHYNDVPFHNFKHGFMVCQMMYGLTWLIDLRSKMDDVDILSLICAAVCHDLDHPGYNNAYQINARTELAMLYNDISPLENHHCSVAFEILSKHEANIFRNLDRDTFKRIRESMIKCILATDMAKHNELLKSFKAIIPIFDMRNKEHKDVMMQIVMKVSDISNEARPLDVAIPWLDCLLKEFFNQLMIILLKVCDISNEARPMEVAEPWLECLLEEYFMQSDMEKLEGLPVAPFMDREKVTKAASQIGFIKFVLLPLFECFAELYPVIVPDVVEPVRKALDHYTEMHQALELEKKRKEEQRESLNTVEVSDGGTNPSKVHLLQRPNASKVVVEESVSNIKLARGWNPKAVPKFVDHQRGST